MILTKYLFEQPLILIMTSYIFLLISAFLSAYILGAFQFYMLEYLVAQHGASSRDWLIQTISAIITIGPVIVYAVSAPLAASIKKSRVMASSLWFGMLLLLFGGLTNWLGSPFLYLAVIGLALGVYSAGKMASVPLASFTIGKSTALTNAIMSVVFLFGILSGLPSGTMFYNHFPQHTYLFFLAGLGIAGLCGLQCKFPNEQTSSFIKEEKKLLSETQNLYKKYSLMLISSPMLWGIAGAANMAITALVVREKLATPQVAAFIPLWAAIGVIAGTLVSPVFNNFRYKVAAAAAFFMLIIIPFFPTVSFSYLVITLTTVVLGFFFGIATNLIDSSFLEFVGNEKKEGTGAALQSAMLALCTVVIGSGVGIALKNNIIPPNAQFIVLSAITLVPVILAVFLVKQQKIVNC